MDKLELDDRIRRLERRTSYHTALFSLIVLLTLLAWWVAGQRSREGSHAELTYPPPPAPVAAEISAMGYVGGMSSFESDLKKAHDLKTRGLITAEDFAAKKAMILNRPISVVDFAEDISTAKKLNVADVLTDQEYDRLKKKILETSR